MRARRIRFIAWGFALLLLATLLTRGWQRRSPVAISKSASTAPGLLQVDGPAEPIIQPATGQEALASLRFRGSHAPSENAIQEPDGPNDAAEPSEPHLASEFEPLPKYDLAESGEAADSITPLPPVELLLAEPKREEAPIAPRAAQEVSRPTQTPVFEGPPPSPLTMMGRTNPAMEPVNNVAREHVQRGFALGERSAVYAARKEFIQALRTITQAVDAQAGLGPKDPQSCSQALARGLNALTEADDLAPEGSRLDGDLDLAAIIDAHRTPACKHRQNIAQLAAMQAYFDFARQELTRAAASNPIASQALTGLGKTYTAGTEQASQRLGNAKAMVFHQAAMSTDAGNHLAANELGVLMATYGQWETAKQSLLTSLRTKRDAATWQNLATVHARLGEHDLARLAEQERQLLLGNKLPNVVSEVDGSPTVQWVDPKAFAGPPEDAQAPRLPTPAAMPSKPSAAKAVPSKLTNSKPATATSGTWGWLPWR